MVFLDSGFPADFDYFSLEMWANFSGVNQGEPIYYNPGDSVMHQGVLYQCVGALPHTDKEPTSHPEVWQALAAPRDNVHLSPTSPYPGHGLLDAP